MSLFEKFIAWMDKRGSSRMITRDGKPYLERFYLLEFNRFSLYIHRFHSSDPDDEHSHPWNNATIVLTGGYNEHYLDNTHFKRVAGDFVFRMASEFHRIEILPEVGPTYTLFWHGWRSRKWGFMTKDRGWIDAAEYDGQEVEIRGRDYVVKGRILPRIVSIKP